MRKLQFSLKDLSAGTVAVIGIPSDENSSFMRGAALAPKRIRDALLSSLTNMFSETGVDLGSEHRFQDLGDLELKTGHALAQIEEAAIALLEREVRILSLGGDHSITYPLIRAHARRYKTLNILQLDAHSDLYDEYEGNRYSHACPFARIMEEGLVQRLVQVGIRTLNAHQREQSERFGVEIIDMRQWQSGMTFRFKEPVYISFDMDVLDPAFVPGVSHREPGGLSTRDAIQIIQNVEGPVIGADIVEYNPKQDPLGITAMIAAKLVKEIAARMLQ